MGRNEEREEKWRSRPRVAWLLRAIIFVAPILIALFLVIALGRAIPRPESWTKTLAWWVALSLFATGVILILDRAFRKLLPIVALFKLSLVFPDRAPPRFKTALRSGTVRQLQRRMESGEFSKAAPQAAAEQLVSLAAALNEHDRQTRGHTERVRAYSVMIGTEMGLSEHELELLNWSGLVHDIGKLAVPAAILNKPGKPTDEEWVVLKSHPAMADALVEPLRPWLGTWAESATQHHERFDGNGYPNGVKGRDITLAGRIVSVADAYDVMTSTRSYKKPMPAEQAREELAVNAGSQFDPDVVRAFLGISIGRLRLVAGPLASLVQLPAGGASLGSATVTGVSALSAVAIASVSGLLSPPVEIPDVVAMTAATDIAVMGLEDEVLTLQLTGLAAEPGVVVTLSETEDGVAEISVGGLVTFTPKADLNGVVELPYTACMEDGRCDGGTLSFSLTAVNDAPVAQDDELVADEDTTAEVDALANDDDVDGDALRILAVTVLEHPDYRLIPASVAFDQRRILVEPEPDQFGEVLLEYTMADPSGATAKATVLVRFDSVNDSPVAVADSAVLVENTASRVDVLANDLDVDGDVLEIVSVASVNGGTATIDGNTVRFVPTPRYVGPAGFTYTMQDPSGLSSTAQVSIVIRDDPARPVLAADTAFVLEDRAVVINVLQNDTSVSALNPGSLLVTKQPANGTATITGGSVRYTPKSNWNGIDSFVYFACDADDYCASSSATITVTSVNDAPTFVVGPDIVVAEDSTAQTVVGWVTGITAGPADEATQSIGFAIAVSNPSMFSALPQLSSIGDLTFTPAANIDGSSTLSITATDNGGTANGASDTSAPVTALITVTGTNDAPVANDDSGAGFTTVEDTPFTTGDVTVNDSDVDGPVDPASVIVVTTTANGALTNNADGTFGYSPNPDFFGTDSFTYTVTDSGSAVSNTATVALTVTTDNDAPRANDDGGAGFTTVEDTPFTTGDVTVNDSDVEDGAADPVSVAVVMTTANGALTNNGDGTFGYLPNGDFFGTDTFTYTITDSEGLASDPGTVTLTVTADNDAPVANDDGGAGFTTVEDTPFTTGDVTVNDSDVDGPVDSASVTVVATTTNGTLTNNGDGTFSYAPDLNFFGADSFTYTITDSEGLTSSPATVTLSVTTDNDKPVANDDSGPGFTTQEDTPFTTADVTTNDSDLEDGAADPASVAVVTTTANGTLTNNGDGTFGYSPNPDFFGTDTFTYTITDSEGLASDPATVTITVTTDNDKPVAVDDGGGLFTTVEDTPFTTGDVTVNDSDVEDGAADPVSVAVVMTTANGALTNNGDGTFGYLPNGDFFGTDTFTYTITDSEGLASDPGTVTLTVTADNDAPVANDDGGAGFTTVEDTPFTTGDVTVNDSDVDGPVDSASVTVVATTTNGTLTNNGDGTFSYAPDLNFFGADSFTYTITDFEGLTSSPATVAIVNDPVNDEPSFNAGVDQVVAEDDPSQTVVGWATGISVGPANESAQSITGFNVFNDNPGLFTAGGQPAVDASGTLTFTPAVNANGLATVTVSVSDDGGTALGGIDTSADQTFTITVSPVNDPPVAVDDGGYSVAEGGSLDTAISGDPAVLVNDLDPETDPLTALLDAGPTNASAFTLNPDGTFSYTHDGSETTSDSFTYSANDGTANSATSATVTIVVSPVNDAPVVVSGQSFGIDEIDPNGTVVGTVVASDIDSPIIGFNIVGGDPAGVFAIDTSGQITIVDNTTLDATTVPSYSLQVTATDGIDTSGTEIVTVSVAQANLPPAFSAASYSFIVNPTAPVGSIIGVTPVSDPDLDTLLYSITAQYPSGTFSIDGAGVIRTIAPMPDPLVVLPPWTIGLLVDDGNGGTDTASVSITMSSKTADLELTVAGGPSAIIGMPFTLDYTVSNFGPDQTTGTKVNVTYSPSELTWRPALSSAGCSESPVGSIQCSYGNIFPSTSWVKSLVFESVVIGPIDIDASVTTASAYDPDPFNDFAPITIASNPSTAGIDLGVMIANAQPGTVGINTDVRFDWTVANYGATDAPPGSILVATLPAGVTFTSGNPSCVYAAPVVSCTIGSTIGSGQRVSNSMFLRSSTSGIKNITFTINPPDVIPGNNTVVKGFTVL